MSIVGFDLGSDTCYISTAKGGGIETVANDYSMRSSPSYVAFGQRQRIICVAAKNQQMTNLRRTFFDFKRLIGRQYDEVANILARMPYTTSKDATSGEVLIEVDYLDKVWELTPTQLMAMVITKLCQTVVDDGSLVKEVVLSVPFYFTDGQRRAMLDAANIAGINVLKAINDTTATAIAYGIYKQDLPAPDADAKNVIFVDCGHEGVQVAACAFNRGKLVVKACAAQTDCGGRAFNEALAMYFTEQFEAKYPSLAGGRLRSNKKAQLKLIAESEKLKKQMSANSNKLPLNIECFMDDIDVSGSIDRAKFEELIAPHLDVIGQALRQAVSLANWKSADVAAIELIGGSSRVPVIRSLISNAFNLSADGGAPTPWPPVQTTMNADEAVSRGCALQCALLSPTFKVREFSVSDVSPYPIRFLWDNTDGMVVFDAQHTVPYSKVITFSKPDNFAVEALYDGGSLIGRFEIGEVLPLKGVSDDPSYLPPDNGEYKVKVKARLTSNGLFNVSSAVRIDRHAKPVTSAKDSAPNESQPADSEAKMDVEGGPTQPARNEDGSTPIKIEFTGKNHAAKDHTMADDINPAPESKVVTRNVTLPVTAFVKSALSQSKLAELMELERGFAEQDKNEKARQDARNAVEEFVYDFRSKLSDALSSYVGEAELASISQQLTATEDWLYGDGEDVSKDVYSQRLEQVKSAGAGVMKRHFEDLSLQAALTTFKNLLAEARTMWLKFETPSPDDSRPAQERFDGYDDAKMSSVDATINEKQAWLAGIDAKVKSWDRKANCTIMESIGTDTAQVRQMMQQFNNDIVSDVLKKIKLRPLPVVEPPKDVDKANCTSKSPNDQDDGKCVQNGHTDDKAGEVMAE